MIKVNKVIENQDGSATLHIEYNPQVLYPLIRTHYKKVRCTQKMIKKFLLKAITNYINTKCKKGAI